MKELTWYGISDDFGVIATGWECPYCEYDHDWVTSYADDEFKCEQCGETSLSTYEMEW